MMSPLHVFENTHTSEKLKLGKKLLLVFIFSFFALNSFTISPASAQGVTLKDALKEISVEKESKFLPISKNPAAPQEELANTIQRATNYLTAMAAGIAILFIVINAGKIVLAFGGSDDITSAKKGLMWALGGLGVVMFAFVIAKTVISLTFSGEV